MTISLVRRALGGYCRRMKKIALLIALAACGTDAVELDQPNCYPVPNLNPSCQRATNDSSTEGWVCAPNEVPPEDWGCVVDAGDLEGRLFCCGR